MRVPPDANAVAAKGHAHNCREMFHLFHTYYTISRGTSAALLADAAGRRISLRRHLLQYVTGRATVNSRMKLRRFTKRLRYRCGLCFARLNHPNPTLRGGLSHGDAASSRVLSQGVSLPAPSRRRGETPHLLALSRPLTTSLTRHILPNSETPNSESNHIATVEKREARGEVVTKPLCQPSELKKQRGQSPIFSAKPTRNNR